MRLHSIFVLALFLVCATCQEDLETEDQENVEVKVKSKSPKKAVSENIVHG